MGYNMLICINDALAIDNILMFAGKISKLLNNLVDKIIILLITILSILIKKYLKLKRITNK